MRRIRFLAGARRDLVNLYKRSETRFGREARSRYELLVGAALRDLAADPDRPGVRNAPSRRPDLRLYPLRLSRERLPPEHRVIRPRHLIVFRADAELVEVFAFLDERMNVPERVQRL